MIGVVVLTIFSLSCGNSANIAKVNGEKITKKQFEAYVQFKRLPVQDEKRKAAFVDQYCKREALAGVIEKEDVLDDAMVNAELNEFKKEMLISRYFEKFLKDQVTDQAVSNYYNTHAAEFEKKKVHIAHILIRTNKMMSEIEKKAKLTTAHEAYTKIKENVPFAEIAEQYSEDTVTQKKGGDLDWINEGSINPTFSTIAFKLKKDEVSEPFETPFGYHIVKVLEEQKVINQPFDAVAGNIRYELKNKIKQAEMERLMSKTKIKIYK